jgi:hypothetical protein
VGDADRAGALLDGFDVLRWVVVIMKVDDWHAK